jgi:bifunctional non-homologous end joining protein LigD
MAKRSARDTAHPDSGPLRVRRSEAKPPSEGPLEVYRDKRDFAKTPEPAPDAGSQPNRALRFVVQKHDAGRLHHDVRLEIAGVMMSFALPKEPTYDPKVKRFAVETEDHPIAYNTFEGRIPEGNYGAGDVIVWDSGHYEPVGLTPEAMRAKGHIHVRFFGEKLKGEWHFVKMKKDREGRDAHNLWLFFKAEDELAGAQVIESSPVPRELLERIGEPMKASSGELDDAATYSFEIKYDGYRILAAKSGKAVRLESRRGHDWTDRFQPVADAIAQLPLRDGVIDGEVMAVTSSGTPSFHRLQQWVGGERRDVQIAFAAFDLPYADGQDLRRKPLEERRARLEALLPKTPSILSFSREIPPPLDARGKPDTKALLAMAKNAGLEGFVAKKRGSFYHAGRSPFWLKLKTIRRQEFAVVGYTPLTNTKNVMGALILAVKGKVGTGFDDAQRRKFTALLDPERIKECPIIIDERIKDARWCNPKLCVEVEFFEWSDDAKLRFPSFVGLREDKSPFDCVREETRDKEQDLPPPSLPPPSSRAKLTNLDKPLFPKDGVTKRDVIAYFDDVAPAMLPHLRGRPLTLQRYPDGIGGEEWFQHHPPQGTPPWVRTMIMPDGDPQMICDDVDTLRWLANLAAFTLHGWNAHVESSIADLSFPDWVALDLDPGDGPFEHVVRVAQALKLLLDQLNLPAYPKTTGKRGLHVFIPIARGANHEEATRLAQHLATAIARVMPDIATVERAVPRRKGKLYVDYLQNGLGKTLAMVYTLRAIDGARVSCPLRWEEVVPGLDPAAFTLKTLRARLDAHGDLFAGALRGGPDIRPLLARLG